MGKKKCDENKVIDLYLQGKNTNEIAEMFNVSTNTVRRYINEHKKNISTNKNLDNDSEKQIKQLEEQNEILMDLYENVQNTNETLLKMIASLQKEKIYKKNKRG